jgi:hypothetical protein
MYLGDETREVSMTAWFEQEAGGSSCLFLVISDSPREVEAAVDQIRLAAGRRWEEEGGD